MAFYLGLDAGGTRTKAALADDTAILARATAGSIKTIRVSPQKAEQNLRTLLDAVTAGSGVSLGSLTATCVGIAGSTVSTVNGWVWNTLGPLISGELEVCGDTEIALDAAFPGGAGVLVIAGTGSNILGRTRSGALLHVGGWGPVLGDEGSGYWIGHQGLRASLRARDRGEPMRLLNAIAAHWGTENLDRIIELAHASFPPDFADLAPIVAQVGHAGDPLAQAILRNAGRELAGDAALALAKVAAADPGAPERCAFTGSVLENITLVRQTFLGELGRLRPAAELRFEAVDPVQGALWRARQLPGEPL